MSVKCVYCGAVNYEEASLCRRCDRTLASAYSVELPRANPVTTPPTPYGESAYAAAPAPSGVSRLRLFGIGLLLLAGAAVGVGLAVTRHAYVTRCSATGAATLDQQYTIRKLKKYGITVNTSYEVTYSFDANGRPYRGKSTLSDEPTMASVAVHYNPVDPSESYVGPMSDEYAATGFGITAGGVGAVLMLTSLAKRAGS